MFHPTVCSRWLTVVYFCQEVGDENSASVRRLDSLDLAPLVDRACEMFWDWRVGQSFNAGLCTALDRCRQSGRE